MGKQKIQKTWILYLISLLLPVFVHAKNVETLKTFRSTEEFLSWCVSTHYNPDFCKQIVVMHKQKGDQRVEWFPDSFIKKSIIYKNEYFIGCSDIEIYSIGYLHNFIYNFRICNRSENGKN